MRTFESQRAPADLAVETGPSPLRFAGVYAFVGSGCMLVLELVAGRILAPSLGVSLYTWTSIIGVVLAGVSLGNYLGGRLADRRPGRGALSTIYVLSALASVLVLVFARTLDSVDAPHSFPALAQVVWLTALLFFAPSTLLGMATPMLVKLSLRSLRTTGRVVGRIQAAAALGSIVGTFATGFFLISAFGTRAIIGGVAGVLLLLGIAANPAWSRRRVIDLTAVAFIILSLTAAAGRPCLRESNYYCIQVADDPRPAVRALLLDRLVHGFVDLDDPSNLLYAYELLYDEVLRARYPSGGLRDAFAIGGGTFTFPRYAASRLGARVLVAEIDPAVTEVARSDLALVDDRRIRIVHDDARRVLGRLDADARFDVVLGDAFNDAAVPFHLSTREFNDLIAAHLTPRGMYLVNVVDGVRYDFLRSLARTLRATFPTVRLMTRNAWPPSGSRDTFVLVAGGAGVPRTPSMLSDGALDAFLGSGTAELLTDDRVPVDQLLAPVFRQRLED